jgi:pimeloyl-ACP methyl ester carboxylesterase
MAGDSDLRRRNVTVEQVTAASKGKRSETTSNDTVKTPRGGVCKLLAHLWIASSALVCLIGYYLRAPAEPVSTDAIEGAGNYWVRLEDGRLLEYAKCGDDKGTPVYAAHGYSQTANAYTAPWMCEIAKNNGLLMISVSMPGFGLSDSMPLGFKRSLLDWPKDVLAVLDKEGVKDFAAFGLSTGCVHACAVANAVPDRITSLILSTPTAPSAVEWYHGIALETQFVKAILPMPIFGDLLAKLMAMVDVRTKLSVVPDIKAATDKMQELGGTHASVRDSFIFDQERATNHTYRGLADNMHTIIDDIPFSLQDLGARLTARGVKIGISTSPDDTTNPPSMQDWFNAQLSGSELLQFPAGWGHLHAYDPPNYDRLVKYLIVTPNQ